MPGHRPPGLQPTPAALGFVWLVSYGFSFEACMLLVAGIGARCPLPACYACLRSQRFVHFPMVTASLSLQIQAVLGRKTVSSDHGLTALIRKAGFRALTDLLAVIMSSY